MSNGDWIPWKTLNEGVHKRDVSFLSDSPSLKYSVS